MATLQEIGASAEAVHKSLEQGQSYLRSCAALCRQYACQLRAGLDGTAAAEYSQILALLQSSEERINKTVGILGGADGTLERWAQAHIGALPGGTFAATGCEAELPDENESAAEESAKSRMLTAEEVNARWGAVLASTEEILENYRAALLEKGIADNKLLDRFLQGQKIRMLKYEAAVLDEASGHGAVKDEDRYRYRIAGAGGEYGFDGLANDYGAFCLAEAARWIGDINPNFRDPFALPGKNPYRVNCGSCAFAVDTRLSGGADLVASPVNIGTDSAMESATGKRCVYMPVEKIEDYLRAHGPGAHVIAGINRGPTPEGCPQAGHWFNVFYDGVNFHTIDGQSGRILEWPHDYGDVTEWCALV